VACLCWRGRLHTTQVVQRCPSTKSIVISRLATTGLLITCHATTRFQLSCRSTTTSTTKVLEPCDADQGIHLTRTTKGLHPTGEQL
jgi:hypothetical protein